MSSRKIPPFRLRPPLFLWGSPGYRPATPYAQLGAPSASFTLCVLFLLLFLPSPGQAEIVSYTDSTGRKHFVDGVERVPTPYRSQVRVESLPKITRLEYPTPRPKISPDAPSTGALVGSHASAPAGKNPSGISGDALKKSLSGLKFPNTNVERYAAPAVTVYLTDWCPYCKATEAFLNSRKIPYRRQNIEKDPAAQREYAALGGRGIPVVKIGSTVIYGYSEEKMRAALGQ